MGSLFDGSVRSTNSAHPTRLRMALLKVYFFYKKDFYTMKLHNCCNHLLEHGKKFIIIVITSWIRSDNLNAWKNQHDRFTNKISADQFQTARSVTIVELHSQHYSTSVILRLLNANSSALGLVCGWRIWLNRINAMLLFIG